MDRETWNAAIRTAATLVEPRPLKADADEFERLAHRIGEVDAKAILRLIDKPELGRAGAA